MTNFNSKLSNEKMERIIGDNKNIIRILKEETDRVESVTNLSLEYYQNKSEVFNEISEVKQKINLINKKVNDIKEDLGDTSNEIKKGFEEITEINNTYSENLTKLNIAHQEEIKKIFEDSIRQIGIVQDEFKKRDKRFQDQLDILTEEIKKLKADKVDTNNKKNNSINKVDNVKQDLGNLSIDPIE
tara:strand:+ start:425 stop:982 length:558 start_codon:yes stop_codon:yes gene_type:complete